MQIGLKRFFHRSLALIFGGCFLSTPIASDIDDGQWVHPGSPAGPSVIVRLRDDARGKSREAPLNKIGVSQRRLGRTNEKMRAQAALRPAFPKLSVVRFNSTREAETGLAVLRKNPAVLYAEPDYKIRLQSGTAGRSPNDFEFNKQTGLLNTARNGGKIGADIHATEAWQIGTGDRNIIVAVIDTGIDYNHPDLAPNIWTNAREIPGNGIDDDGNGFVDDVHGYDFVASDSDPFDDNEHGTHVSGIIGAAGNNGIGISGVCWNVSLMAVKAFGSDGSGNLSDVIEAIDYAVQNGARIINASWGLDTRSQSLEDVVNAAQAAGVLFVAAAGNDRSESPFYPAAYPNVISVAATDAFDQRAIFSNFGTNITVAAPGQDIYSTVPNASYAFLSGTSMAAPHVSGLAALILGLRPNFSMDALRAIIINTSDSIQTDHPLGRGRINARAALEQRIPLPTIALKIPVLIYGAQDLAGDISGLRLGDYILSLASGKAATNFTIIAEGSGSTVHGILAANFQSDLFPDGPCTFKLEAENSDGGRTTAFASSVIANTAITEPLSYDIRRAGELIEIRGRVAEGATVFRMEYAPGLTPNQWSALGIELANAEEQKAGLLAKWDTSQVVSNEFYSLRLSLGADGPSTRANFIYLDSHLKAGWPRHVPINGDFPIEDWRNAVVSDLDGDGPKEIVLLDHGSDSAPARLLVFRADGELFWSRALEAGAPYYDIPTIGDLDGDGMPEVIVDVAGKLFVFRGNGDPLPGWPISVETPNRAKIVADLNADGQNELITYAQEPITKFGFDWRELTVFNSAGKILRQWDIPFCAATNDAPKLFPAVANLDTDPELEIVAQSGCDSISAYKLSSARSPIWTAHISGNIVASPVIGDVNHDGTNRIIVATTPDEGGSGGGLYLFNARGELQRGWPMLAGESLLATPALGDFDGDGMLEISFPSAGSRKLHLIQSDGFEADGWPVPLGDSAVSGSTVIGDIDGDGIPDVVMASPGYLNLATKNNDATEIGGIKAWNFQGGAIPLNGVGSNPSLPLEETGTPAWFKAASITLADVDHDGLLDLVASSIQERSYSVAGQTGSLKNRSGIYVWNLGVAARAENLPWPQFQQRSEHTGFLPPVSVHSGPARPLRQRLSVFEERTLKISPLLDPAFFLASFTQPTNGLVNTNELLQLVYQPARGFHGLDGFSYIRSRSDTNETVPVSILVKPRNHPPVATNQTVIVNKNLSKSIFLGVKDPDGDTLTFNVDPAAHGDLWVSHGFVTYFPRNGFTGSDSFNYTASDSASTSDSAHVQITVTDTNNPPSALPNELLVRAGRSIQFALLGRDVDKDPLSFLVSTAPKHGGLTGSPEALSYTPAAGFVGVDRLQFTTSDGFATSEPAEVVITVTDTNTPPMALGQTVKTPPNHPLTILLSGTDPESDPLTFRILAQPEHGSIQQQDNSVTYEPNSNYQGPDRFSFSTFDGEFESDPAVVDIYVARTNGIPIPKTQNFSGATNQSININLSVFDPDNDPISASILDGPQHGLLWGSGTNFMYVPNPDFGGLDSFSYEPWDGIAYGPMSIVTINITPLQASVPSFKSIQILEDGTIELVVFQKPQTPVSLEWSPNLYEWFQFFQAPGGTNTFRAIDTNALESARFYRIHPSP